MSETKIVVNKHFRNPASITGDVFAVGGSARGGYFAEGEIVICSNVDNPGLYLMTGVTGMTHHGNVINITSGEFIRLSSAYTESQGEGSALVVHTGDTIDVAVGKIVKRVNDISSHLMPNTGEGLIVSNDTLSVNFDHNTIILDEDRHWLKVNPEIIQHGDNIYLSESEYQYLVEHHEVSDDITYYTFEDE